MSRRFALLVNPASAGGKALDALPAVHETLDALGAPHRTVLTRSIEHAEEEAAAAAAAGETVAAVSGDGLLRPLAAALKNTDSAVALIPCGRGNDFARVLGVPTEPAAAARVAVEGEERLVDVANVDGTPFVGIASFGFDSDANRIANDTKRIKGDAVYLYAALRALAAWKPARSASPSTAASTRPPASPWWSATRRPTAAACTSSPRPSSTTGGSTC